MYRYRVSAGDGYGVSEFSGYETVTIFPTSIESVLADACGFCEIYTIGGVLVYSGNKENIPALSPGTYIIKCGDVIEKIAF